MTVTHTADGVIALLGACPIEDAENLYQFLLSQPQASIDWRECEQAHTAVVQLLLVCNRSVLGPPKGGFLREKIAPILERDST